MDLRTGLVASFLMLLAAPAIAQSVAPTAKAAQSCTVNGVDCAGVASDGAPAVSLAQVSSQLTSFGSVNIAMPNGGHLAHPIFIGAYPTGLAITGTTSQSVFSATGAGSLSMPAGAMNYVGAQFVLRDAGVASTGALNVATVNATAILGGVALFSQSTLALPASVNVIPFLSDITCTVQAAGTAGKMSCQGSMRFGSGVASVSPFETFVIVSAPVTVDLTQALTWDARATLSSTIGTPSLTVYSASIWQTN